MLAVAGTTLSACSGTNAASDAPNLAGITYMMFCSGDEKSPFYDLRVRQAVMYAVDWEAMA